MDIYIPEDLFRDKSNIPKVSDLLQKYFSSDVVDADSMDPEEEFFKELKELNEPEVYGYMKAN